MEYRHWLDTANCDMPGRPNIAFTYNGVWDFKNLPVVVYSDFILQAQRRGEVGIEAIKDSTEDGSDRSYTRILRTDRVLGWSDK